MTRADAKQLKVGQRVEWLPDHSEGTIEQATYAAITIKWDDGQSSLLPFGDERAPIENVEVVY